MYTHTYIHWGVRKRRVSIKGGLGCLYRETSVTPVIRPGFRVFVICQNESRSGFSPSHEEPNPNHVHHEVLVNANSRSSKPTPFKNALCLKACLSFDEQELALMCRESYKALVKANSRSSKPTPVGPGSRSSGPAPVEPGSRRTGLVLVGPGSRRARRPSGAGARFCSGAAFGGGAAGARWGAASGGVARLVCV